MPSGLPVDAVRREHERAVAQLVDVVLGTDADGDALVEQVTHERHDHDLLLEHLEQPATPAPRWRTRPARRRSGSRRRRRAARRRTSPAGTAPRRRACTSRSTTGSPVGRGRRRCCRATARAARRRASRSRGRSGRRRSLRRSRSLPSRSSRSRAPRPPARSSGWRSTSCALRTRAASNCGPTTTAAWLRESGEQLAGLVEQVLERACAAEAKNSATARRCAGRERARLGEVVDEVAVALVGRDPAGRRVGLDDVALALELGHVVADRGARDPERRATAAMVCDATGWAVWTYSSTIARSTAARRSTASMSCTPFGLRCGVRLAVESTDCYLRRAEPERSGRPRRPGSRVVTSEARRRPRAGQDDPVPGRSRPDPSATSSVDAARPRAPAGPRPRPGCGSRASAPPRPGPARRAPRAPASGDAPAPIAAM